MNRKLLSLLIVIYLQYAICNNLQIVDDEIDEISLLENSNEEVSQVVLVKYTGVRSDALISFYEKKNNTWNKTVSCKGYIGKNGVGKQKEGDMKTPLGTFNLASAFGIKQNPGTSLNYTLVNKNHYWCSDVYYNTLIDIKEKPHHCTGEHLIDIKPQYNYAMVLDYNKECVRGKGSGIFFHGTGRNHYTAGCVAINEKDLVTILKAAKPGIKMHVYQ